MTDQEVERAICNQEIVCLKCVPSKQTTYPAGIVVAKHGKDTQRRVVYEIVITSPGWCLEVGYLVAARADELFISSEYLCHQ